MGSAIYDAMRQYAECGWYVFPCHGILSGRCTCGRDDCPSPGKRPETTNGLLDATLDPDRISEWAAKWPFANVGIRTGIESGIVVIDIDPAHGGLEAWLGLLSFYGSIPATIEAITGSGGIHLFFQHPGPEIRIKTGKNDLGPGVDSRGDGGYVVAPPSAHLQGHYQWKPGHAPGEIELAPLPAWIMDQLATKPEDAPRIATSPDSVRKIHEGEGRNADLASFAGGLRRRGMTVEDMLPVLTKYSETHHEPPLSEREISDVAKHIARYEQGNPQLSTPSRITVPEYDDGTEIESIEVDQFMQQPDPVVNWLLDEVLLLGGTSLLGAKSGVGKSTIMRNLMLATASEGAEFLGRTLQHGPVVGFFLEENQAMLRRQLRAMLAGWEKTYPIHLSFVAPGEGLLPKFQRLLERVRPVLVVVDPLQDLLQIAELKSYEQCRAAMKPYAQLAEQYGAHIAYIHHFGKGQVSLLDAFLGSAGIVASVDTAMAYRTEAGVRLLCSVKNRWGLDLPDTVIHLDRETYRVSSGGTAEEQEIQAYSERIVEALSDGELDEPNLCLRLPDLRRGQISKVLRRLVAEQKVMQRGAGQRGNRFLYSVPLALSESLSSAVVASLQEIPGLLSNWDDLPEVEL